ncbi:MAG: hypothetical protein ACTHM8_06330 [Sphingomonas sp.]
MRIILPILAAAVLAAPVSAADTPAKPTQAQLESAQKTLSYIISAINSKEVPAELKNGLFGCLYENSLSKISNARDEVIAKNKGKIDEANPTQQLVVIAEICGAPLPKPAAGAATPAPKAAPKGR